MDKLAVIAIGGNSLIKDKDHQRVVDQYEAIRETVTHIVDIIEMGINVVITHGNGPQVGFIMRRSEVAVEFAHMHPVPLVSCDADTQGAIGYQIQQAMRNEFMKRGISKQAVTIVTQVVVDREDKAFKEPTKPIGSFFEAAQIEIMKKEHPDWHFIFDAGRGYRRVVPSPKPKKIIEEDAISALIENDFSVIAVGGGGIPVFEDNGELTGVNAVIDKDYASALLAYQLKADYFIISTAVDQVCVDFNKPSQKGLSQMTLADIETYRNEGQFAKGSMLPKINACELFIKQGGKKAIITKPSNLKNAVMGNGGTTIMP